MKKIDYYKLAEITVKSQGELDAIPEDFGGRIYIEFGTPLCSAVLKKNYKIPVVARNNSSVVAWGNVQIANFQPSEERIRTGGNARVVYSPRNIQEFIDFYGISCNNKTAVFYKAVHKDGNIYRADRNPNFIYKIGESVKERCDPNKTEKCGSGIHIAHLAWALDFGRNWPDLAIIEVETDIDKIVVPNNTDGKVRTSEVKVIREVPLEECGILGKILAKRRAGNGWQEITAR